MPRHRLNRVASAVLALLAAASAGGSDAVDVHFAEAFYHAHQGKYFDALERLDAELGQHYGLDEPNLDSLYPLIRSAEFSVGDFELNYRMHHRAGRAIRAVLEGDVDEEVRNEAAYRLARIHFQKGQLTEALHALDRIEGAIPKGLDADIEFLRANVYLGTGRADEAALVLKRIQGVEHLTGFSEYNLAIAYLNGDHAAAAMKQLERAGAVPAVDEATHAIRDKANLVRGTLLLDAGDLEASRRALDQVRLTGPFANQALLSAGRAETSAQRFERAIVPLNILTERNVTDPAVQEARLALPYVYGQLAVHGRAATLYADALQSFGAELTKLDASITSIRDGKFLEALAREEIRQDKDWVIRLRALPDAPETYYLMELLASHDFQAALQNYLDLEDLQQRLRHWRRGFVAYDGLIGARRAYYEPLLPDVDRQFGELDAHRNLRLEQLDILSRRLEGMLTAPRPEFLATEAEMSLAAALERIEAHLDSAGEPADSPLRERVARLRGPMIWAQKTTYHERLTAFYRNLEASREAATLLARRHESFVRNRQAATHSYEGYEDFQLLSTRTQAAVVRIEVLKARQGRVLEQVAIAELRGRSRQLAQYEERARFALADSYDRATVARVQTTGQTPAEAGEEIVQ
jgi:tetratricopeptide (TPR) repeat protein